MPPNVVIAGRPGTGKTSLITMLTFYAVVTSFNLIELEPCSTRIDAVDAAESTITELEKIFQSNNDGIMAFIFVLKFGARFTKAERALFKILEIFFGESFIKDNVIIVFNFGDDLLRTGKTFEEWLKEQTDNSLGNLIQMCRRRCILVDTVRGSDERKKAQCKKVMATLTNDIEKELTLEDFQSRKERNMERLISNAKSEKENQELTNAKDDFVMTLCAMNTGKGDESESEIESKLAHIVKKSNPSYIRNVYDRLKSMTQVQ